MIFNRTDFGITKFSLSLKIRKQNIVKFLNKIYIFFKIDKFNLIFFCYFINLRIILLFFFYCLFYYKKFYKKCPLKMFLFFCLQMFYFRYTKIIVFYKRHKLMRRKTKKIHNQTHIAHMFLFLFTHKRKD